MKNNEFGASMHQTTKELSAAKLLFLSQLFLTLSASQHLTVSVFSLHSFSSLEITPNIYNPYSFPPFSRYQMGDSGVSR